MKNLLIAIAVLCTQQGFAQQDDMEAKPDSRFTWYARAGVIWALRQPGDETFVTRTSSGAMDIRPTSFSSGLNGTVAVGYMLNKHWGIECGAYRGLANTRYSFVSLSGKYTGTEQSAAMQLIIPSILLQVGEGKIKYYTRIGLVLPTITQVKIETNYSDSTGSHQNTTSVDTRFTIGGTWAFGVGYKPIPNVSLFIEANVLAYAPYINSSTLTASTLNGTDNLASYTPEERQTLYEFNGIAERYPNKRQQVDFTRGLPFRNVGIQAGLAIGLTKKKIAIDTSTRVCKRRFYIKGGLGYAAPFASNTIAAYGAAVNATGELYIDMLTGQGKLDVFNVKPLSYSTGLSATVGLGYQLSPFVSLELNMNQGIANKKYLQEVHVFGDSLGVRTYSGVFKMTTYAQHLCFAIPSIVLQTPGSYSGGYTRFGLVIPVSDVIVVEEDNTYPGMHNKNSTTYSTRFSIGYNAALGFSYKLNDRFSIWSEASIISYSPYLKDQDGSLPYSNLGFNGGIRKDL